VEGRLKVFERGERTVSFNPRQSEIYRYPWKTYRYLEYDSILRQVFHPVEQSQGRPTIREFDSKALPSEVALRGLSTHER
jgi:hypothetical protein